MRVVITITSTTDDPSFDEEGCVLEVVEAISEHIEGEGLVDTAVSDVSVDWALTITEG